jgi:hypothetical protein
MMGWLNVAKCHKTKHSKKGDYKMEGPMSTQKEETTNESGLHGEHEQIKYSNPL